MFIKTDLERIFKIPGFVPLWMGSDFTHTAWCHQLQQTAVDGKERAEFASELA